MISRTHFWPLVRCEAAIDRYSVPAIIVGAIFWLGLWWGTAVLPWMLIFKGGGSLDGVFDVFGFALPAITFIWLMAAACLFGEALIPWNSGVPGHRESFEFLFSRAIDRRTLYRAKVALVYFAMLTPIFVDFVGSFIIPSLSRGGGRAYTGWLLSMEILIILFIQACYACLGKFLKGRGWMTLIVLGVPLLAALTFAICFMKTTIEFYNESFRLFAAHVLAVPIVLLLMFAEVQLFSERKYEESEIF